MRKTQAPTSAQTAVKNCRDKGSGPLTPSKKVIVLDGPIELLGEPIEAVIPAKEDFKDYGIRVKELIESLAVLEERPIEKIISDIVNTRVD